METPVYRREALPADAAIPGPAVIQQLDTTILVEPGSEATTDALGNLVLSVPQAVAEVGEAAARDLDPVTLAVIESSLQQVASEMDLVHQRTSFSPVISEAYDRSNGIYQPDTGEIIARGERGLPIFLGVMQSTTQAVIEARDDLEPGDIVLVNDPYFDGTHLMDVKMVRPFFYRGRLWAYLSNTGHWPDTGGMVPGGFPSQATKIQQEGLRLPPVKLRRRGVLDDDIMQIVLANIRVPEERIGDICAQIDALSVGERRLTQLLDRHGEVTVSNAIEVLKERSERSMRAHIASVPDGEYVFLQLHGFRRRERRGAGGQRAGYGLGQRHRRGFLRLQPALSRAGELDLGDDAGLGLLRHQAHLPGRAHQRRLLPTHRGGAAARHLPLCRVSPARLRLRGGDGAAHHGGGLRRDGRGHAGAHVRRARRHQRQLQPRRRRPGRGAPLRHVHLLGRRLRRLVGGRRPHQRLLLGRHLQDPAGRDPGAALPDPV